MHVTAHTTRQCTALLQLSTHTAWQLVVAREVISSQYPPCRHLQCGTMGFIFPFNSLVRLRRALSYRWQMLALILHSLEQVLSTKWPRTQVCTPLITSWKILTGGSNIHLRNRQRQHKKSSSTIYTRSTRSCL